MDGNISFCGLDCSKCEHYPDRCIGCKALKGKVWWTSDAGLTGGCPISKCCLTKKQIYHCGLCRLLPCENYYLMKDPSMTDEEHEKTIRDRVEFLTRQR